MTFTTWSTAIEPPVTSFTIDGLPDGYVAQLYNSAGALKDFGSVVGDSVLLDGGMLDAAPWPAMFYGELRIYDAGTQAAPINVEDFGAVGDGITDDTAAISLAIASLVKGDMLFFPAGTYIVNTDAPIGEIFTIAKEQIKVCGDGIGRSIIKIADGCSAYGAVFCNAGHDVDGLEASHLTFDHNIDNNPIGPNLAGGLVDEGTWNGGTTYHVKDIVLQPDTGSYYKCILQHVNQEPPGEPPSETYWTLASSEIVPFPEISVSVGFGSNLYIHDIEVINASSGINFCIGGTNIVIEFITCSNVGDDPNHIVHDTSIIYSEASDILIQNCNFTAAFEHSPGAVTAIETHGSNSLVQNNTVTDFQAGVNACGAQPGVESSGVRVTGNQFQNVYGGVWIWSNPYPGDDSPPAYGINGLEIDHNDIDLAPATDASIYRFGIAFYWNSISDTNDVNIHDNTVSMSAIDSVPSDIKWFNFAIGVVTGEPTKESNITIADNVITNFQSNAIRFQYCDIQNVSVTGNTFKDCASALPSSEGTPASPILVNGHAVDTLDISGNAFIDDIPVTRIHNWFYLIADHSCTGLTISGNTYSMTGDKVAFAQPIRINENTSQPLLTENILNFVPPNHKVNPASVVHDGATTWTVDATGLTWTQV